MKKFPKIKLLLTNGKEFESSKIKNSIVLFFNLDESNSLSFVN